MVDKENTERKLTIVDLQPQTGRYHQIRRHLASIGHPIYGDPLFEESGERRNTKRQKLNPSQQDCNKANAKDVANGETASVLHDQDSCGDPMDEEQFWSDASIDEELKKSIKQKIRKGEKEVREDINLEQLQGGKESPEVKINFNSDQIQEGAFTGQVMLWASGLEFVHPMDGRKFFIQVEEPKYFKQLLENFNLIGKE
eukprot:TRINITY_DN2864_c2_g1_i2.p2 TRINITY_DN2864_c2_g1~~TRINITY_DN2864_c2_g1_i2.p2  ORF type:complete len:199 (-),score=41.71 TRINITY_DN2864_c2_g1_i2:194-790(-)